MEFLILSWEISIGLGTFLRKDMRKNIFHCLRFIVLWK